MRLFGKNPELLKTMDAFEIHALYYGVMNGLVGQELAERICALAPGAKFFHRLYYRLLAKLYEKYPTKDMLTAVCCLLIKGNVRGKDFGKFVAFISNAFDISLNCSQPQAIVLMIE